MRSFMSYIDKKPESLSYSKFTDIMSNAQHQLERHSIIDKQIIYEVFSNLHRTLWDSMQVPNLSKENTSLKETISALSAQVDCLTEAKLDITHMKKELEISYREIAVLKEENFKLTSKSNSTFASHEHTFAFQTAKNPGNAENRLKTKVKTLIEHNTTLDKDVKAFHQDYAELSKKYQKQITLNSKVKKRWEVFRKKKQEETDVLHEKIRHLQGMYDNVVLRYKELQIQLLAANEQINRHNLPC